MAKVTHSTKMFMYGIIFVIRKLDKCRNRMFSSKALLLLFFFPISNFVLGKSKPIKCTVFHSIYVQFLKFTGSHVIEISVSISLPSNFRSHLPISNSILSFNNKSNWKFPYQLIHLRFIYMYPLLFYHQFTSAHSIHIFLPNQKCQSTKRNEKFNTQRRTNWFVCWLDGKWKERRLRE